MDLSLPLVYATRQFVLHGFPCSRMLTSVVAFFAYDILESNGEDIRYKTMTERRLLLEQIVKACRVKFAEGEVIWVGEIDDSDIEWLHVGRIEPDKGIAVRHRNARVVEGMMIQLAKRREILRKSGHHRIEIDELNLFDRRVFKYLPKCKPVTTAEHQRMLQMPDELALRDSDIHQMN